MNSLQKFYHWIANTPPLFKAKPPFTTFESIPHTSLADEERYEGNPRLGFLYQHLCTRLLSSSPRYEILAEEIQLNDATGRTIGAVDLILRNQEQKSHEHWEVAIKFYLLYKGIWYGPNAHDQLHKKLDRMLTHQLKMSQREEFHQQLPLSDTPIEHLLMQGRLYINPFSPEETPTECLGFELDHNQISGFWCYHSQLDQVNEPLYELSKPLWAIGTEEFSEPVEPSNDRFVHAQTQSGRFWFVVPDSWPNNKSS
ncbi:DUF1853 family protein [Vibrio mexicanus]|uniref:DUF1853 family protein n=1 Tax=Vibrio mexicanus TaxID=1004326 RepID=UPI00063BFE0D|nr:DUF1853 family protein [Vibrio mexicanus]